MIFAGVGDLFLVRIFLNISARPVNANISQAAKNARGGEDTLAGVFERLEIFFRRLDIHPDVPPTTEMMDMTIRILVEVFSILGIATKEIKQGRMSE
jgi:hypothetical protein